MWNKEGQIVRYSRLIVFAVSIVISGGLLLLFALGYFDKAPQQVNAAERPQILAQDSGDSSSGDQSGGGSGNQSTTPPSGDSSQGTELQPSEQDEENSEKSPGRL